MSFFMLIPQPRFQAYRLKEYNKICCSKPLRYYQTNAPPL